MPINLELLNHLSEATEDVKPAERPEDPTQLFILYYGGHAVERDGNMVWRPSENAEEQTEVVWTSILDNFKDFDGDLLFLFDCCYAGNMVNYGRIFNRRCEVFCASNKRKKASGEPEHSFTRALLGELAIEAEMGRGCEIKRLHSVLNLEAKRDIYQLKVEPYWDRFTRLDGTPICLAPLENGGGDNRPRDSPGIVQELEALSDARVLFKATFEDPDARPILDEWKDFVHWRPRNLKDIEWYALRETHFQSLFKTNSSSAIISTPMILWDSMPRRVAYEFIYIVRSTDMLGNLPRPIQATGSVDEQNIGHSSCGGVTIHGLL
ncbi:Peptidase C14, caspase catalytic [Ilyonectria robusta]